MITPDPNPESDNVGRKHSGGAIVVLFVVLTVACLAGLVIGAYLFGR